MRTTTPVDTGYADISGLLLRIGAGSAEAFAQLYDEYSPFVHGITSSGVLDPSDAERVTEAVFLQLWRSAPRYRAELSGLRWILVLTRDQIARRTTIDRISARPEPDHRRPLAVPVAEFEGMAAEARR